MAMIICPKCKEPTDRLHRYNSGDAWMCPTCYVGMYCHPTPQTLWQRDIKETDNVLTFSDTSESKAFKDYLNKEFNRILYSNLEEHGKQFK